MKVVDLFCGCGGFSLGFDYIEEFELIYALDNWEVACRSYEANFPHVDVDCRNALDVNPEEIPQADIIVGSPPCHDFSSAKMSNRTPDLSLVNWFLSIIDYLKPQYWILENVPPLKKYLNHPSHTFTMHLYGIPQIRRRLFAGNFNLPKKCPTKIAFPAVLALESRWKSSFYIDKLAPRKNPRRRGLGASSAFRRLSLIPELKLIQTFPLDFILMGSLKDQYTQIGNAVPPLMAYRLAEAILNPDQTIFEV